MCLGKGTPHSRFCIRPAMFHLVLASPCNPSATLIRVTQGPYPLLDPSSIRARLALAAGPRDAVEAGRPIMEAAIDSPPLVLLSPLSRQEWVAAGYALTSSAIAATLPPQV